MFFIYKCSERGQVVYKHYAIGISGKEFQVEGIVREIGRSTICSIA